MSDPNITEWHPPQEKAVRAFIKWGGIALVVLAAAIAIKIYVPTIADALGILQHLLANTISTAITAGVLAAVLIVLWQTFSPNGKINALFAQAYSSFIHNITVEMLNVDPMSPLKDSLAAVKAKKAVYDEQFAKFDGQIRTFKDKEDALRADAKKAESRAKAALAQGDQENFKKQSYIQGTENETADTIAAMRKRLEPVREIIVRLQSYSGDLIWKLGIDIENTETTWNAAKSMSEMDRAARGIVTDGGKSSLALEAQQIVQNKYSAAIGRLENLNDLAKPLLDSADLDKATYSQDLLAKWQAEDAGLQPAITAQVVTPAISAAPQSSFAGLIGR